MDSSLLFGFAGVLLIGLAVGYFITDWWHKITKRVNIQQSQLFLLSKIAEKNNVHAEDIEKALLHAKGNQSLHDVFDK